MPGAQVGAVDYRPGGWPPDCYTIVRRVRVETADISHDVRSRRRRTIPAGQLTLALDGKLDHVHAVSFIVTNIPTSGQKSNGDTFDTILDIETVPRPRRHRGPNPGGETRRSLAASALSYLESGS